MDTVATRRVVTEGPSPKQSRVRGHLVKIDADNLNTFLETPVVLSEGETLPTYSRYCRFPIDYREIEAALCIPGRGFILNAEGHPRKILRKDLTTLAQVWSSSRAFAEGRSLGSVNSRCQAARHLLKSWTVRRPSCLPRTRRSIVRARWISPPFSPWKF